MSHLECQVCLERYNSVDHCPRSLTCGHFICTSCLGGLLKDGKLICPKCRTPYRGQVNSVTDVPVVYDLLPLLQESSRKKFHLDDIFKSLKKESTDTTSVKTLALEEQIKSLRAQLSTLNGQAEVNNKVTKEINQQLEENKEMVHQEIDYVKEALETALAAKISVMDSLQAAKEATTLRDILPAHEEAKRCCEASEKSLQRNQKLLQRKVLENSLKAHSAYEAFLEKGDGHMEEPQPEPQLAQPSTSSWKEPEVFKGTITTQLIKTGRRMGQVWAVTTWNGNSRYALLSRERDDFLLHCFQDGKPPAGSLVLEFESLLQFPAEENMRFFKQIYCGDLYDDYDNPNLRNLCKRFFFLELSWLSGKRQKVWIESDGTDKRSQLFRHLCLGDKGPSYVNTRMESKGIDPSGWVFVTGGKGRSKDDRKDLFGNVNSGVVSPNVKHFGIRNVWNVEMSIDDDCLGTFSIYTQSTSSDQPSSNNFVGRVCDGSGLLKEILRLPNIKDVKITDSGARIPKIRDY